MSGVYLYVAQPPGTPKVLFYTEGGHPHITLAWVPKQLRPENRAESGFMALTGKTVSTLMFHKRLTVERVAIHSFTKDDGTERHDVLLFFDYEGECLVERLRRAAAVEDCVQGRPHVTVGTFNTRQQAESRMALVIEHGVIGMGLRIIGVSWTTAA